MRLKTISLLVLILALIPLACKKAGDKPYMASAIITGYDARMCACCGGLMINFENNTNSYTGAFYIISNPDFVGVTANSTFPIYLNVDYNTYTTALCQANTHITITRFSKL